MGLIVVDPVEGQEALLLVQIHTHPPGPGRTQHGLCASVPQSKARARPVQSPGLEVVAKPAAVVRVLPVYLPVGHTHGYLGEVGIGG